ncbi:hypothetical protein ACJX0J_016315 [Zea mays]
MRYNSVNGGEIVFEKIMHISAACQENLPRDGSHSMVHTSKKNTDYLPIFLDHHESLSQPSLHYAKGCHVINWRRKYWTKYQKKWTTGVILPSIGMIVFSMGWMSPNLSAALAMVGHDIIDIDAVEAPENYPHLDTCVSTSDSKIVNLRL